MKIEYRNGDLMKTPERFILHGCNAQGVMGSGVAKLIRAKYPKAYDDYRKHFEKTGLVLGEMIFSEQPDGKTIINAITQDTYGKTGIHVSYDAINTIFHKLNKYLVEGETVAMPLIGAGLGGGDWDIIEAAIEEYSKTYQPVVYRL